MENTKGHYDFIEHGLNLNWVDLKTKSNFPTSGA